MDRITQVCARPANWVFVLVGMCCFAFVMVFTVENRSSSVIGGHAFAHLQPSGHNTPVRGPGGRSRGRGRGNGGGRGEVSQERGRERGRGSARGRGGRSRGHYEGGHSGRARRGGGSL